MKRPLALRKDSYWDVATLSCLILLASVDASSVQADQGYLNTEDENEALPMVLRHAFVFSTSDAANSVRVFYSAATDVITVEVGHTGLYKYRPIERWNIPGDELSYGPPSIDFHALGDAGVLHVQSGKKGFYTSTLYLISQHGVEEFASFGNEDSRSYFPEMQETTTVVDSTYRMYSCDGDKSSYPQRVEIHVKSAAYKNNAYGIEFESSNEAWIFQSEHNDKSYYHWDGVDLEPIAHQCQ